MIELKLADDKGNKLEGMRPSDKIHFKLPNGQVGHIEAKDFIRFLEYHRGGSVYEWQERYAKERKAELDLDMHHRRMNEFHKMD